MLFIKHQFKYWPDSKLFLFQGQFGFWSGATMIAPTEGLLAAVTVVFTSLCYIYLTAKTRAMLAKIPGPRSLPFIGNAHQIKTGAAGTSLLLLLFLFNFRTSPSHCVTRWPNE